MLVIADLRMIDPPATEMPGTDVGMCPVGMASLGVPECTLAAASSRRAASSRGDTTAVGLSTPVSRRALLFPSTQCSNKQTLSDQR